MNLEIRRNNVFKKYDRRFLIITDDIDLTYENWNSSLEEFEFAEDVEYMDIGDAMDKFNKRLSLTTDKCQYTIFDINDVGSIIESEEIFYLMNSLRTNKFEFGAIESDEDKDRLQKAYRTLYGSDISERYVMSMEDVLEFISGKILPKNIMVAFISDNDDYMNALFDKYFGSIDESDGHDEDDDTVDSIQTDAYLPCRGLPKIYEGWIYRIWYGESDETDSQDIETPETTFDDSSTESYTKRTYIVKLNNNTTVTYVWIKPNKDLMLNSILSEFDTVYLDLSTFYASIVLNNKVCKPIRYFLSYDKPQELLDLLNNQDNSYAVNVIKNYLQYMNISDTRVRVQSLFVDQDKNDLSGTIKVADNMIAFYNIAHINDIVIEPDTK